MSDTCTTKHATYQPTEEEFCCPKCQAPAGDFYVYESENEECDLVHDNDFLYCSKCRHEVSGKVLVKNLLLKKNKVKCPTCKGCGVVDGPKPAR